MAFSSGLLNSNSETFAHVFLDSFSREEIIGKKKKIFFDTFRSFSHFLHFLDFVFFFFFLGLLNLVEVNKLYM